MNDTWNGESRGCADVMFTRIQNIVRNHDVTRKYGNLYDSVIMLATWCEEDDVRLTDILEKVYLELKEDTNEVSR
jgi:hypothetical protein